MIDVLVFIAIWFFFGCVAFAVWLQVAAMFAGMAGFANSHKPRKIEPRYRTIAMRVRDYDIDEDY